MFERRELTKNVHINSKFLQKNMKIALLNQLQADYEGMCSAEGFINRNSIQILDYSLGKINYVRGGIDYTIKFHADVCMPHPKQTLKAKVSMRSKIGIHAENLPIKVLIPRDLHLNHPTFAEIKEGDEIEFEVVGAEFKQKDLYIVVVGKLESKVDSPVLTFKTETEVPEIVLTETRQNPEERHVTITQPEQPRKRQLKQNKGTINESRKERVDEESNRRNVSFAT